MAFAIISIYLIIIATVIPAVCIVSSVFFMIYFQHPDEKFTAWFPKIITLAGLNLACFSVLLLPLDAANVFLGAGFTGMDIVWQILYGVVALFVVILVPFAIFYYEAQDPDEGIFYQVKWAIIYMTVTLVIVIVAFLLLYFFLGFARIPYSLHTQAQYYTDTTTAVANFRVDKCTTGTCTVESKALEFQVSPVVYGIALMSLVGWVCFLVFGGCGLTAFPIVMILSFINRPRPMDPKDYLQRKTELKKRAQTLMEAGKDLQERMKSETGRKIRNQYNDYKKDVLEMESDFQFLEIAFKDKGGSPILHLSKLIGGIIAAIVSLAWLLHIILYMIISQFIPTTIGFLNDLFLEIDKNIPGLGAAFYGLFAFHLLFCVIGGNLRLSQKLAFLSVHPLTIGGTYANSFLFNTAIFLLSAIVVTQFSATAFSIYAKQSAVDALFRTYIQNLWIFGEYFFRYYQYVFLGFALLGMLLSFLFICDKPRSKRPKK